MHPVIGITCSTADSGNSVGTGYTSAIVYAGGTPILLPSIRDNSCIDNFISLIDGLLLSGGVDVDPLFYGEEPHPSMGKIDIDRDYAEMALIPKALEIDLPIFGICRGIQILNVAAGGTLYQDISMSSVPVLKHRQDAPGSYATHTIDIKEESRLISILRQPVFRTNSFHHQAVKKAAPGFMISAVSRDGIVEGIESTHHNFVVGVQFHPELMWQNNPPITSLFVAFINAAKVYKQHHRETSGIR